MVGLVVGVEFTTMPSNIHTLYFNCGDGGMDRFSRKSRRSRICITGSSKKTNKQTNKLTLILERRFFAEKTKAGEMGSRTSLVHSLSWTRSSSPG